ncbi:MAG TPA: peptidogalycan biosysnthesis protein, partial [Pseudomonadales bacterium]|nr:peptidogalycan biosysnthesis protein [Pseudomonadales bacterium]
MNFRFLDSITAVEPDAWNAIAGVDYPFLRHEFLYALEASGSASKKRGWQPQHLLIEENNELVALMPLYIKSHSMGEFVFDHSWAQAFQRYGYAYYPKLLIAIPFTPATGPRLAHRECDINALQRAVYSALKQKLKALNASGWHALFVESREFPLWAALGGSQRIDCQFQWQNKGYAHFDDFLSTFASRKRKALRKERERISAQEISFKRLHGAAITPA